MRRTPIDNQQEEAEERSPIDPNTTTSVILFVLLHRKRFYDFAIDIVMNVNLTLLHHQVEFFVDQ